jgi:hypothetical protein
MADRQVQEGLRRRGWEVYQRARDIMETEFTEVQTADASRWPARIAVLLDAQDAALRTAEAWDSIASGLVRLHHRLVSMVGADAAPRLHEVLKTLPDAWHISGHGNHQDFCYGSPLAGRVRGTIMTQNKRIRMISALASGRNPE